MQRLAIEAELTADKVMWQSRALLHAPVGAYLARRDYGLSDPAALDAIRWHTTGRANMSILEQVIYLADMIEPGRKDFEGLGAIRDAARHSLGKAMRLSLLDTIAYVQEGNKGIHPATLEALRWFESGRG